MNVTAIIFDLDGTLVDSSPDITAALNRAFVPLEVRSLEAPEVLAMLGGGPRHLVSRALDAAGAPTDAATLDAALVRYSAEYLAEPSAGSTFFADAALALPALAGHGIKLGICTNKRTDLADLLLTHLGVRDYFGSLMGVDRTSQQKPSAAHLNETIAELGAMPSECLYVGDTAIDRATAEAAGVEYLHVAWGHKVAGSTRRLEQFADLFPLISSFSDRRTE